MIFNDYECYLLLKSANHVLKDICHLKALGIWCPANIIILWLS